MCFFFAKISIYLLDINLFLFFSFFIKEYRDAIELKKQKQQYPDTDAENRAKLKRKNDRKHIGSKMLGKDYDYNEEFNSETYVNN